MKQTLLKLPPNRVRRNYLGGAGIDALRGAAAFVDSDRPEDWIGSMVEAANPGMEEIPHEGLASIKLPDGTKAFLRDLAEAEWDFYFGKNIPKRSGGQVSFLFKILDSAMRLHVQAHPTTAFANTVMGKPYGKLECYYILSVREGVDPYIRLGFQHAPSKEEWKSIIETQDMARMDACFEKIPVSVGEIWYIPGGMPHAIGEGITLLEIMEPSDLVVRCEFEREGIVVPETARFMGHDLDFCLDIFDYTEYSIEETVKKCRVTPTVLSETPACKKLRLIDERLTPCFYVEKLEISEESSFVHNHQFTVGIVVSGTCRIKTEDAELTLRAGDAYVLAAAADAYTVTPLPDENGRETPAEICYVYPGRDMEA